MKKNVASRILIALMIVIMVFPNTDIPVLASGGRSSGVMGIYDAGSSEPTLVRGVTEPSYIDKYGNIYLSITNEEFFDAGYEYGDIVKVKILGKKFSLPVVSSYSDVDSGKLALIVSEDKQYLRLALNMGSFATEYGLATKTVSEDGTFEWNFPEGTSEPVKVSVWLKKKGGYADEYLIRQIKSSDIRDEYPDLLDEEFANFRQVNTTGMGLGILYRTSSPIDPSINRNKYADNAIKEAGVNVILNLTDTQDSVKEYEGYSETYYSTVKTFEIPLSMDYKSEEFENMLAEGLRFMVENPGIYAIHCKEGKDRAGFVSAILECLMGAEYFEVVDDYMLSFYNYYGLKKDDPAYEAIINGNFEKTLKSAFTFSKKDKKKDLSTRNLAKCAVKYLKKIGLSSAEIKKLKKNLSQSVDFIDKNVNVKTGGENVDSLKLRFYSDEPNIPYIGIKSFYEFLGFDHSYSTDELGRTVITNKNRIEAVFDTGAGTISSDNWEFFNRYDPSSAVSYCRFGREVVSDYKETGKTAVFDLGKYGLKMIPDENDIYISLSLASNLRSEPTGGTLGWNGRYVFADFIGEINHLRELSDSLTIKKMFVSKERPKDIADETFKELCFIFDNLYGHPSVALLAEDIKEKGFYTALLEYSDETRAILAGLQSTDTAEYYQALNKLFFVYLDDNGHTVPTDVSDSIFYKIIALVDNTDAAELKKLLMNAGFNKTISMYRILLSEGSSLWGKNYYLEYDNTAFIRLVSFTYDEDGWKKYFLEGGELPQDPVGVTVAGLKKASANPKIENIVFDLTANSGGNTDILGFITGITTGNNIINGYNEINDWTPLRIVEADFNLDGVFDDKDKIYDRFNYGVLTTKAAFSCGNEFPMMMQEAGAVLIGEPSVGGSCNVLGMVQPDGTVFSMSSSYCISAHEGVEDAENGCNIDVPIEPKLTIKADGSIIYDYSAYYDLENLDRIMDEWFAK